MDEAELSFEVVENTSCFLRTSRETCKLQTEDFNAWDTDGCSPSTKSHPLDHTLSSLSFFFFFPPKLIPPAPQAFLLSSFLLLLLLSEFLLICRLAASIQRAIKRGLVLQASLRYRAFAQIATRLTSRSDSPCYYRNAR